MLKVLFFAMVLPSLVFAAKKTIRVQNIVVESQKDFMVQGKKGKLVKFEKVRNEIFLPLEGKNAQASVLEALDSSEESQQPLKIKLVSAGQEIIQYRGKAGSQVLAMGAGCRKTKNADRPRLFCNKGYFVESVELMDEPLEAELVE